VKAVRRLARVRKRRFMGERERDGRSGLSANRLKCPLSFWPQSIIRTTTDIVVTTFLIPSSSPLSQTPQGETIARMTKAASLRRGRIGKSVQGMVWQGMIWMTSGYRIS
jgi:hypothetical protein